MGVPRFFKWVAERYPCVVAPLTENSMPSIDNLYLDMNGIIHNCTAPETEGGLRLKLSPKEVVLRVFQYVDKLFNMAKPRKHFFMAIDGVAPRAKMNQQRQRRFRSAAEADKLRKELLQKGEALPDESLIFDGNAITPGTEFMAELSQHLHYLIHKKMQEDIKWQQCNVIFSGHSVPGEGEHKIMDFIRARKMEETYDPNETHCLYGLDADLIMLGLVAHEPHFVLLREDVFSQYRFGKQKQDHKPLTEKFHLLHLSALREYFQMEFKDLQLPFMFDLERIIDDFVLMCFFCGNDFIPHMPTLDIKEGAILTLFEAYKLVLPTFEGYMTSAGTIHWERVEAFVKKLGERENSILASRAQQQARGGRGNKRRFPRETKQVSPVVSVQEAKQQQQQPVRTNVTQAVFSDVGLTAEQLHDQIMKHEQLLNYDAGGAVGMDAVLGVHSVMDFQQPATLDYGVDNPLGEIGNVWEDDEEEDSSFSEQEDLLSLAKGEKFDFKKWHKAYYTQKFQIPHDDAQAKKDVVVAYVEALTWVYNYYYQGCMSWNWFYRYHYSPICSDLVGLAEIAKTVHLDMGKPFHPYEQLLGVLPPKSSSLIPVAYSELMLDHKSVISDFYPQGDIEIDREGTKYEWEGVVKLPFIDEERLLGAVGNINQARLSADEIARNQFGPNYIFRYDPKTDYTYKSSLPSELPDIVHCHCKAEAYEFPQTGRFVPELCDGVRTGTNGLEGFPALFSRTVISDSRFAPIALFGQPSKSPCMVIHLDTQEYKRKLELQEKSIEEELEEIQLGDQKPKVTADSARHLIGKRVYIGYPYPRLAIVSSLCDDTGSYYDTTGRKEVHSHRDREEFQRECNFHRSILLKKNGIESGDVNVLLFVKLFKGMEKQSNGSIQRTFYEEEFAYPYQLLVSEYNPRPDPRFVERGPPAVAKEYAPDTPVVYLGGENSQYYGLVGRVQSVSEVRGVSTQIELKIKNPKTSTPIYPTELGNYTSSRWYNLRKIAEKTGLQSKTIGLLLGAIKVELPDGKLSHSIGLQLRSLKLNKRVVGYCRCEYNEQNLDESYFLNFQTGTDMNRPSNTKFSVGGTFGWELSDKALQLILDFKQEFAELVSVIDNAENAKLRCTEIFPSITQQIRQDPNLANDARKSQQLYELQVKKIGDFIRSRGIMNLPFVSSDTEMFPKELVKQIEQSAITHEKQYQDNADYPNTVIVPTPRFLYKPGDPFPKDLNARSHMVIGQRVVSISGTGSVPLGHQGILVGIEGESGEVIFDEEFIGGTTLSGKLGTRRGAVVQLQQLLNLSNPKFRTLKPQQKQKFHNAQVNAQVPKISAPVKIEPFVQPTLEMQNQQQPVKEKKPRVVKEKVVPVNVFTALATDSQTQQTREPRGPKEHHGGQQQGGRGRGRGRGEQPQHGGQPHQRAPHHGQHGHHAPQQQVIPPPQGTQQSPTTTGAPQQEGEYLKNWDPSAVFRNKQQKHRQDRKPQPFTPSQVHKSKPQGGRGVPVEGGHQPHGHQGGRGRGRGRGYQQTEHAPPQQFNPQGSVEQFYQQPPEGYYYPPQGAYPPNYYPPQQGGYPPQPMFYVPPPQQGYPPHQPQYPPQQGGYPPQPYHYVPNPHYQQPYYPPQQGGQAPQQPPQQFEPK